MSFKLETHCVRDCIHGSMSEKGKPLGGSLDHKDNFLLVLGDIGFNTQNTCKKSMFSDFALGGEALLRKINIYFSLDIEQWT